MENFQRLYEIDFTNGVITDLAGMYQILANKNKQSEIRLAIVGSRSITDEKLVERIFNVFKYMFGAPKEIVSGGAKGPDSFGENWAKKNNIPVKIFKAEWEKYGKSAGFKRNEDIIANCDVCLAIWDGKSHGTKNDFEWCKKYKKEVLVFNTTEYMTNEFSGFYYASFEEDNNTQETPIEEKSEPTPNPTPHKKYTKNNRWLPQSGVIEI